MPPVVAFIAAGIEAIGVSATIATAVASFIVQAGAVLAFNAAIGAIFGKKSGSAAQAAQDRQASVTSLQIGENSRELIVGRAGTGGSLADAFNWGGEYGTDNETLIIALADHKCDAFEGALVNDTWAPYEGDGVVTGFNGQLSWWFLPGTAGQVMPADVLDHGPGWTAADNLAGVACLVVTYTADKPDAQSPVWTAGRPRFLAVVRGALCYDPRLDDTVGGSGSHRWTDPDTWEWSENLEICRYKYARGVYALDQVDQADQLLVGRGLSTEEAPPQAVFAFANLCDELVDLGGGASEARYRVGGVIRADQAFIDVETMFAQACAGEIIQPEGSVQVEPGYAKSAVFEFTDADLVAGETVQFNGFLSDANRINTVIPRYIEPAQKWADTAAGVQRLDTLSITADGGPREEPLPLSLVTSRTQAERVGAIRLRKVRLERSAAVVLGPRFSDLEDGDWGGWTSKRYLAGARVVFRVNAYSVGANWRNALALEEISADVYGFGADGVDLPIPPIPAPPDALALAGVTAIPILINGTDGSAVPAVRFGWTVPADPAILRIRAEIRHLGDSDIAATLTDAVAAGTVVVTNGVAASRPIEARLVPIGPVGRPIVPSAWFGMDIGGLIAGDTITVGGRPAADIVSEIDLNADELAKEILRGEARDAFQNAMNFLAGQSLATVVQVLQASFTTANSAYAAYFTLLGAVNGTSDGWILAGGSVFLPDGSTTLASYITTVNGSLGDLSGSVTTLSDVVIGPDGVTSKWVLSVNSDGHIAGMELISDGTTAEFYVVADQFGFIDPGDGTAPATVPFSYASGLLRMHSVEVDTIAANVVDTQHLVDHSVTQPVISVTGQTFGTGISNYILVGSVSLTVATASFFAIGVSWTMAQDGSHLLWAFDLKLDGTTIANGAFNLAQGLCAKQTAAALSAGTHTVDLYWAGPTSTYVDQSTVTAEARKK